MAGNVTNWVWDHSRAVNGSLIVLLAIAHDANRDGEAEMSVKELAQKARLSERSVQTAVKELTAAGELRGSHGGGRGHRTRYRMIMVKGADSAPFEPGNPAESAPIPASNPAESAPFTETPQNLHPLTEAGNPAESAPFTDHHRRSGHGPQLNPAESAPLQTSDVLKTSTGIEEVQVKDVSAIGEATAAPAQDRPDVERLCYHLADRIEANGSKRPEITKRWRSAARLMLDRDGRTEQQITAAIDWCQGNEFWRANILSMPKLREKYDQLRLQATRANGGGHKSTTAERVNEAREAGRRVGAMFRGES